MNAGRLHAQSEWLLFLHADTRLPSTQTLSRAVAAMRPRHCGHFPLTFRTRDERFRFLEAKTALSREFTTNGDQGFLVEASLFDEVGGFDESLPFLEDQKFCVATRRVGATWFALPDTITTSTRRFETEGFGRRYFAMALIMAAWAGGADEFFEVAPMAYRANPRTPLDVEGLLGALRKAHPRMGIVRAARAWRRAASFARRNAWQTFFAADVALAEELDGEHPFLDIYDAYVEPLLDNSLCDAVIAATAFVTLMGVLPTGFAAQRGANWVRIRIKTPNTTTATAT